MYGVGKYVSGAQKLPEVEDIGLASTEDVWPPLNQN